jgi:hypothetical protein
MMKGRFNSHFCCQPNAHHCRVDTKSRASVLAEYLAYQSVTERLAFPHPAKQPQLKAQGTEKWLDEWQASWEKLRRA